MKGRRAAGTTRTSNETTGNVFTFLRISGIKRRRTVKVKRVCLILVILFHLVLVHSSCTEDPVIPSVGHHSLEDQWLPQYHRHALHPCGCNGPARWGHGSVLLPRLLLWHQGAECYQADARSLFLIFLSRLPLPWLSPHPPLIPREQLFFICFSFVFK